MSHDAIALQRPAPTEAQFRQDLWLGVGVFIGGMVSAALTATSGMYGFTGDKLYLAVIAVVIYSVSIALRRRFPCTTAVVACTTYFLAMTLTVPEIYAGNVAMFITIYTVGAWVNDRKRANWVRYGIITGMMIWLMISMFVSATSPDLTPDEDISKAGFASPLVAYMILNLLLNIGFFGGAFFLGNRTYDSAMEQLVLQDQRRALDAERELTAAQAVALDRVAIARELHDVVAHHVSAMGVQAGAARAVFDSKPDAAIAALQTIEASARDAISELRLLLESLRTPGGSMANDSASTLRISHIPELVRTATDVGMPTTFTIVGEERPVPDTVQVNLYRIAQEALTNARRHGGPHATADVRLRYTADAVELEVANTGWVTRTKGAGLGQLGMRERAAASGGTIELRPRESSGFLVRVKVPLYELELAP